MPDVRHDTLPAVTHFESHREFAVQRKLISLAQIYMVRDRIYHGGIAETADGAEINSCYIFKKTHKIRLHTITPILILSCVPGTR